MKCPKCRSINFIRKGKARDGAKRFRCRDCGKQFRETTSILHKAKILLFDIETTPIPVYVWQLKQNNYIHIGQIVEIDDTWNMVCWRAKWLFDDKVLGDCQTPEEARNRDDKRITKSLYQLINEADILIGHNVDNFDIPKANTRFMIHGLDPPSPYQTIDTLKAVRKSFKFASNKLDFVCQKLGMGAKYDTGFPLWKDCLKGDKKALKNMYDYCGQDTAILEDLYLRVRGWIKSHPNLSLYLEDREGACSNCGSKEISYLSKPYYTPTGEYQSFRCKDCGATIRSRYSKKREKELLRSCAR